MKVVRLLSVFLFVMVIFAGCSKSEDETKTRNNVPANGEGVIYDTINNKTTKVRLWINDYVVLNYVTKGEEPFYSSGLDFNYDGRFDYVYYPFTMDIIYQILEDTTILTDVNKNTDFSKYPSIASFIQYCESHRSLYKYVSYISGDFFFFNRTINSNY